MCFVITLRYNEELEAYKPAPMKSFSLSISSFVLLVVPESNKLPIISDNPALLPSKAGSEPITKLKETLGILVFVESITFIPLSKSKTTGSAILISGAALGVRSEERRVGKECRFRWSRGYCMESREKSEG